jgi:hypothetical protein
MDPASGVAADGGDCVNEGHGCVIDQDSANNFSQNKINSCRNYPDELRFKYSTHESRSWERDLTTDACNSCKSNVCVENVFTARDSVQKDACKDWPPMYENMSDGESDTDLIIGTKLSKKGKYDFVSTKYMNVDCDRPKNSASQSRDSDVRRRKAVSVNKRRYSSPEDSLRKRKKKEKQIKRHRRRPFDTDSDIPQTDHRPTMTKPYLNKLVLWKDAKIKSWNVGVDLAHDDQGIEEVKEGDENTETKEATTVKAEEASSGILDSAHTSRPFDEQMKCEDYTGSEFNRKMNIEDEDTVEAPRSCFSFPRDEVNSTCNSKSVEGECSFLFTETVFGPNDWMSIPRSSASNLVITSAPGIHNEKEIKDEVSSETPESQTNKSSVVAESSVTKPDNTAPTRVNLFADKSNFHVRRVKDSLERSSYDSSQVSRIESEEQVEGIPCSSANTMRTNEYSETHNQSKDVAPKKSRVSPELPGNLGSDVCRNEVSGAGMGRRRCSIENSSGITSDDAAKKGGFSNPTADSHFANTEGVSGVTNNCATTENSVTASNAVCSRNFEEQDYLGHKRDDSIVETCKAKTSRNFENRPSVALKKVSSQRDVTGEENINKRSLANNNSGDSSGSHQPINCGQVKENENYSVDSDKELAAGESMVGRVTDQAHMTHEANAKIGSESIDENPQVAHESRELTNGNRSSSMSKVRKKRRRKVRIVSIDKAQHETSKEASGDGYKGIVRKPSILRKSRYSRRRFRHDSIKMFKVSTIFPPHTTPVPWRYKCNKPQLSGPIEANGVNPSPPILNSSRTQLEFDGSVTNIEIEDDIPSPASLTIDLGEQNSNAPETPDVEDETSRKKCNSDSSSGEEEAISLLRRKSCETDSVRTREETALDASTESGQKHTQSGDLVSESSDEGQSRTKRKRAKKRKSGMMFQSLSIPTNCMYKAVNLIVHACLYVL